MDKYAVIGHPIAHSLSPIIHSAFAKQAKREIVYTKIDSPLGQFSNTLSRFFSEGGRACNITAPFKEEAFLLADHHSEAAQSAQSANVLTRQPDGSLTADNTDGIGFIRDLKQNLGFDLKQKSILIVGAGGATRGILKPILSENPSRVVIANRTLEKALDLSRTFSFSNELSAVSLNDLHQESPFKLIVHATSAGQHSAAPDLPSSIVDRETSCYDLAYGEAAKPFLNWAIEEGAGHCIDGLGLLIEQAAEAFFIWHDFYPDTQAIQAELRSFISDHTPQKRSGV